MGANGTGILNVSSGSLANFSSVLMGRANSSNGTITVNNATFIDAGGLTIGKVSVGTFNVQAGSTVFSQIATMAQTSSSNATATLGGTNANWTISQTLAVGFSGRATVSISNGAVLNINALNSSGGDALNIGENTTAIGTVTVTGPNSLLLSAGNIAIGNDGSGTLTVSAACLVSAPTATIAVRTGSVGTLNIGAASGSAAAMPGEFNAGSIDMGNGTATINLNHTSNALVFSPAITGNGTVNVLAGTSIFVGNSTYLGNTTISAGATLQLGGAPGFTNSGGIDSSVANNGTLIANRADALTLPGLISGSGQFQQLGAGTTILTGVNTYSGLTTISAGTLQIGNVTSHSSLGTGAVVDNSVLEVNRFDNYSLANPISGTGQFIQLGTGITALTADDTFTGTTTITAGTLQFGGNGTTGSVASNIIIDNSILAVSRSNSLTLSPGDFRQRTVSTARRGHHRSHRR